MPVTLDWSPYFEIADSSMPYSDKLADYAAIARERFQAVEFEEFCATHLAHAEDCMATYVESAEFDAHLVACIQRAFPPHEHDEFVAHYRGLLGAWVTDQRAAAGQP